MYSLSSFQSVWKYQCSQHSWPSHSVSCFQIHFVLIYQPRAGRTDQTAKIRVHVSESLCVHRGQSFVIIVQCLVALLSPASKSQKSFCLCDFGWQSNAGRGAPRPTPPPIVDRYSKVGTRCRASAARSASQTGHVVFYVISVGRAYGQSTNNDTASKSSPLMQTAPRTTVYQSVGV